jgi:hypothetical protein
VAFKSDESMEEFPVEIIAEILSRLPASEISHLWRRAATEDQVEEYSVSFT